MLPLSLFDDAAATAPAAVPPPASAAGAAPAAAPLAAGARVMARHGGKAPWYAGAVAAVRADGRLDIAYDDGDHEEGVPPHLVRPAAAPAATDAPAATSGHAAFTESAPSQRRFVSRGLHSGVSTSPRSANLASAVMRGALRTLHTHGFVVLPVGHGGHLVDQPVLRSIRASRFEPIFNGQPAGEPPQRHQGPPTRLRAHPPPAPELRPPAARCEASCCSSSSPRSMSKESVSTGTCAILDAESWS